MIYVIVAGDGRILETTGSETDAKDSGWLLRPCVVFACEQIPEGATNFSDIPAPKWHDFFS